MFLLSIKNVNFVIIFSSGSITYINQFDMFLAYVEPFKASFFLFFITIVSQKKFCILRDIKWIDDWS